ncbi:MAG: hypothetical protein LBU07_05155 [Coriobacteriales bacterium]|jgi:membrane protein insertase Oxa1/YidC/SpoIIIJ|nr:hypothetical protein [Coriobacteriales bacterium]
MKKGTWAWAAMLSIALLVATLTCAIIMCAKKSEAQQRVIQEQEARLDNLNDTLKYALEAGDIQRLRQQMIE